MTTYNECEAFFLARGDYANAPERQFTSTPNDYTYDKDSELGVCQMFIEVQSLGGDNGDMHFLAKIEQAGTIFCFYWRNRVLLQVPKPVLTTSGATAARNPGKLRRTCCAHHWSYARVRLWRNQSLLLPFGKCRQLQFRLPVEE